MASTKPLIIYFNPLSPPSRSVLITANLLGLKWEGKMIDFAKADNKKPDYLKINPLGTVPAIIDNDHILYDSHAITSYLLRKHAPNHPLYPTDLAKRSIIDCRMHFDSGSLFPISHAAYHEVLMDNQWDYSDRAIERIEQCYHGLNTACLNNGKNEYLAGNHLTLADISCYPNVSQVESVKLIDETKYPALADWMKRMSSLPVMEMNDKNVSKFKHVMIKIRKMNKIASENKSIKQKDVQ